MLFQTRTTLGLMACAAALGLAAPASANVARAWLAQGGSDSGSCTFAAPCATIAFAAAQVSAGGEVVMLDGGNYAGGTVNKSLIIRGAGIKPTVNSITVAAASGERVMFDNIAFSGKTGDGSTGYTTGLNLWSGSDVLVSNCLFAGYSTAIDAQGPATIRLTLIDTMIYGSSSYGIRSLGINGGQLKIKMLDSKLVANAVAGVYLDAAGSDLLVSGSTILGSAGAVRLLSGATGRSYGTNVITNGDALIAVPLN